MAEQFNEDILEQLRELNRSMRSAATNAGGQSNSSYTPQSSDNSMSPLKKASAEAAAVLKKEKEEREKNLRKLGSSVDGLANTFIGTMGKMTKGGATFEDMAATVTSVTKVLSNLASTLGPLGSALGKGFEAAAAANQIMVSQFQAGYDAFKKMSASGLTNSFSDLRDSSKAMGLRMEQLAEVTTKYSKDLAGLGGASGGLRKLTELGKASGDLRDKFYQMGINAQEFTEYQAEYITQGQKMGMIQGLTQAQLKKGTEQYIEELDGLTKITGMSRKEAQDARKSVQADDRVRATLNGENANAKQGMTDMIVMMKKQFGDDFAKGFAHSMTAANTEEAKAFQLQTAGGVDAQEMLEKMRGAGSAEEREKIQLDYMKKIQESLKSTESQRADLAKYGAGGLYTKNFAQSADATSNEIISAEQLSKDKAIKNGNIQTDATTKAMGQMQEKLDLTSVALQQLATRSDMVLKSINWTIDAYAKATEYLEKGADLMADSNKWLDMLKDHWKELAGGITAAVGAFAVVKGVLGSFSGSSGLGASAAKPMYVKDISGGGGGGGAPGGGGGAPGGGGGGGGKGGGGGGGKFSKIGGMLKGGVAALAGLPVGVAADFATEKGYEKTGAGLSAVSQALEWGGTGAAAGAFLGPMGAMIGGALGGIAGAGYSLYNNFKAGGTLDQSAAGKLDMDSILEFGSDSGSRENFEDLDDSFKSRVLLAAQAYNQATGKKIKINSAFRDPEKQKELYDKWIASGKQGKPVAPPGQSLHNRGAAVDIQNYNDPEAIKAFNSQGLSQKVPNDPVHFQARTGGIFKGPSTGYNVELHGDEAVIPMNDGVSKQAMNNSMFNQDDNAMKMVADVLSTIADQNNEIINLLSDANSFHKKTATALA